MEEYGLDQNSGVVSIAGSFSSIDCLSACQNQNVEVTGCESHVDGGCAYHTEPVSGGSGDVGYTCWKFGKCTSDRINLTQLPLYARINLK